MKHATFSNDGRLARAFGYLLPSFVLTSLGALALCGPVRAAELTTNGSGGGPWSDPATWRGKVAPGPDDDVVIRKGDLVVFDRNDDGTVSCQKLLIDPKGGFSFKTGAGKVVCCVAGGIETYGPINLDGTKSAGDILELRLVSPDAKKREIKLLKGAALLARGRADLPKDGRNVALTSPKVGQQTAEVIGHLEAGAASMIDMQRAVIANIGVRALDIDNTGSKPNEKLNIVESRFTGYAYVFCQRCDTPVIAKNRFEFAGAKGSGLRAIHVTECPLPEVRGNVIQGHYNYGLAIGHSADGTFTGNTIEKCDFGLHIAFGKGNSVNQNTINACEVGFELHFTDLVTLAENTVDGAKTAVRSLHSTAQFHTLQVTNLAKDGLALVHAADERPASGPVTLINCNVAPAQVRVEKQPEKKDQPLVTAMCYLIVAVKGAPADSEVEVQTKDLKLAPDAADLNVRNSPAPLVKDMTPVPVPAGAPEMFAPLVVKAWVISPDGKPVSAPEYTVRVLAPADKPDAPRKVLKSVTVKPADDWFRAKPDEGKPTLEVSLK